MDDTTAMSAAITAAAAVRARTSPNPWVGAVLLSPDGALLATGATEAPGGRHAEIVALDAAGERRRRCSWSDARVHARAVLAPRAHAAVHGRDHRRRCAHASSSASPTPTTVSPGRASTRSAVPASTVDVGVGAAAVEAQLAPYLHHRRTGRPYVVCKLATTADGAHRGARRHVAVDHRRGRQTRRAPVAGRERRDPRRRRHRARRRSRRSPCATSTATTRCAWYSARHHRTRGCTRASSGTAASTSCSTSSGDEASSN